MKVLWILAGIFSAVGTALIAGGLIYYVSSEAFFDGAETVTGEIVDYDRHERTTRDADTGTRRTTVTYRKVYTYEVDGREYTDTSSYGSGRPGDDVGQPITVYYDPENPSQSRVEDIGSASWIGFIIAGVGLVFESIGLGIGLSLWRGAQLDKLIGHAPSVPGKIVDVKMLTNIRINNEHPYRVVIEWQNPHTQQLERIESKMFRRNPKPFLEETRIDTVNVYYDPQNPKRYRADFTFLPHA